MTYEDFLARYVAAADRVEADVMSLTPAQRRNHSRSERINRIKARHLMLVTAGLVPIALVTDDYRGDLVPLYKSDGVLITADRQRQPSACKPSGVKGRYGVEVIRKSIAAAQEA